MYERLQARRGRKDEFSGQTRLGVQAKLRVGAADDRYEREADRVANEVTFVLDRLDGGSDHAPPMAPSATRIVQRVRPNDPPDMASTESAGSAGFHGGPVNAEVEGRIRASVGASLAPDVQRDMETAFGTGFGHVKIHTGSGAERLNRELGARAFTVGSDVFFGSGEYQPRSPVGRRILAHELTHSIQQSAGGVAHRVQRVRDPLTTKEVLAALGKITFLKGKLATDLHGSTMEVRVAEMLRSWKEHFAAKTNPDVDLRDAMMLSMALEGVARIISEELNDVSVQPVVSAKLFELYRDGVGSKIKGQRRKLTGAKRTKVLDLTEALVGDDPVTRFMHREISVDVAAASIATMAAKAQLADATITPVRMFELMEQKFQVKMASYQQGQLHQDVANERFSARESPGEYSTYFFEKMFGANAFATADAGDKVIWNAGAPTAADRLAFSQEAEAKLAELRQRVQQPAGQPAVVPRQGVTAGQERHLRNIEAAEQQVGIAGVKAQFVDSFQTRYHLTAGAADTLYTDVANHLATTPLTITVKAQQWFGGAAAPNPDFRPAAAAVAQTPVATAFGKAGAAGNITHLPTWDDTGIPLGEQRGPKYLRFRAWKDELMSGLNQLSSAEKAVFGALNVNWDLTRGSDSAAMHGENYYGDLHFVLDRATVGNRMIYTATDHGQHRRDPLLALHDFAFGDRGITWLQDTKKLGMVDNIVNAVTARKPLYGLPLLFEVQIFGGVHIVNDVTEVHLGAQVSAALETAVRNFYNGTGINVVKAGAAPAGSLQTGGPDVDEMLMKELVGSTFLGAAEKQAIDVDVAAGATLTPQLASLMKSVMTVADYVTKMATDNAATLTPIDFTNLTAAVTKIKGVAGYINTAQQFSAGDRANVKRRIDAAEAALQAAALLQQQQQAPPQQAAPQQAAQQPPPRRRRGLVRQPAVRV